MKVRQRRAPVPEVDELGAELGVDWAQWADGRAFRLKRKRDFPNVDPGLARTAAAHGAERMGKVVQSVRDKQFPEKFIWVQFADHEIHIGDPCPCGSRRLLRLHTHFARCPECRSQLLLLAPSLDEDDAVEVGSQKGSVLKELTDVRLDRLDRSGDAELYRGYGRQETGDPVLLLVEVRAEPGEELSPEEALDRVQKVKKVPFEMLSDLLDVSTFLARDESDWDLVL